MLLDSVSQNVECHPLPFSHRKGCNETAFHKMYNVTHFLLGIGKDVMNHETALHKMCNVTHTLLVMGKDVMTLHFKKVQCSLLSAIGHRKRCDENVSQNVQFSSHSIAHIGKDSMRLPFTKCGMPLTVTNS